MKLLGSRPERLLVAGDGTMFGLAAFGLAAGVAQGAGRRWTALPPASSAASLDPKNGTLRQRAVREDAIRRGEA
jgi:hypothetical protein